MPLLLYKYDPMGVVNPWRTCAAEVITVVSLSVCLYTGFYLLPHYLLHT